MKKIVVYLAGLSMSGGKERVVANLLNEWSKRYEITLITKDSKDSFYPIPTGIKRITLNTPFIKSMYNLHASRASRAVATYFNMRNSIKRLKHVLKKMEYDYIYVTTPLNAYEAYKAMAEPKKKLVVSEHASINAYNSTYSKMKKNIYPRAYCISVPNRMDTDDYKQWGCNAVYVPHPITFSACRNLPAKEKVVMNVGRLTSDKQQDTLIRIWKTIDPDKRKGWSLWIIGSGEDESKLKKIAYRKEDASIRFIPATKDIASLYKKASVFAFTSRMEGFGMVLLEAMAFGVPCISFDCPSGPRDVIDNGKNGFLIPNKDSTRFRDCLENFLVLSDVEWNKFSENALGTIDAWNTDSIMGMWDKIFK